MTITGEQLREIQDVLLATFPAYGSLDQLVRFGLDQNLAVIAGPGNLGEVVHKLLEWAVADDRLCDLLRAAARERPRNAKLQALAAGCESSAAISPGLSPPGPNEKLRVLFLSASPSGATPVALDKQQNAIREAIRKGEARSRIDVQVVGGARVEDLFQELQQVRPHIFHFTGHGNEYGQLSFTDDDNKAHIVTPEAIAGLFEALPAEKRPRVALFITCNSGALARAVVAHVDCVIGMQHNLGEEPSILFPAELYRSLSFGGTVKEAFDLGVARLRFAKPRDGKIRDQSETPLLLARPGVDPAMLRLL